MSFVFAIFSNVSGQRQFDLFMSIVGGREIGKENRQCLEAK